MFVCTNFSYSLPPLSCRVIVKYRTTRFTQGLDVQNRLTAKYRLRPSSRPFQPGPSSPGRLATSITSLKFNYINMKVSRALSNDGIYQGCMQTRQT